MTVLTLLIALAAVTGTAAAAPIITDSDSNLSTDTKTTIHTFTPRAFYTCPEGDSWCGKYIGWWVGLVALGIIGFISLVRLLICIQDRIRGARWTRQSAHSDYNLPEFYRETTPDVQLERPHIARTRTSQDNLSYLGDNIPLDQRNPLQPGFEHPLPPYSPNLPLGEKRIYRKPVPQLPEYAATPSPTNSGGAN